MDTVNETGMVTGLLPAALDVMVIEPWYEPALIPLALTVATKVDGVVLADAETLSQLGDVEMVKATADPPERLMDWLAGLAPPACVVKLKLAGLAVSVGLPETTRPTSKISGELVAPGLRIETVAV
jgi:hypothetical protein